MKPAIQITELTTHRLGVLQACQTAWETQSGYQPCRTHDVHAVIWLRQKNLIQRISLKEWIPTPVGSTLLQVLTLDLDNVLEWIKQSIERLPSFEATWGPTPAAAPDSHVSVEPSHCDGFESST